MKFRNTQNPQRRWVVARYAALMLLCLVTMRVHAFDQCVTNIKTYTLTVPKTLYVPKSAPVGAVLATALLDGSDALWTCNLKKGERYGVELKKGDFSNATALMIDTLRVYESGVKGVGIAFFAAPKVPPWSFRPQDIFPDWSGLFTTDANSTAFGARIAIRLVKTGEQAVGRIPSTIVAYAAPTAGVREENQTVTFRTSNDILIVDRTCDIQKNVAVDLGQHLSTELGGVGTFTSAKAFAISLTNCPAGMIGINYRVDAVTAVKNQAQSVVALDGASTAKGVGVQLLDSDGKPLPLATKSAFKGYLSYMDGDYKIPLGARYYQTDAKVTAGTANSSMTFTIEYQ